MVIKSYSFNRITIFLLMAVFMFSMVSALEFDNVKSYDSVSREVTITNALGLGDTIGKARLNTPLNVKVGLGYQKVAEFDVWAYEDYSSALKEFSFIDMKSGKSIDRNIDLKYKTYETIVVDDYKTICSVDKEIDLKETNKTQNCESIKVGEHKEQRVKWVDFGKTDFKKDDKLTIGLFTDVKDGDFVDWIPTIYGKKVVEWASWEASLNTDLISYWKLDDASGDLIDAHGDNDATYNGALYGETGIINDAVGFDGSNDIAVLGDLGLNGENSATFNLWIKKSGEQSGTYPMIISRDSVNTDSAFNVKDTGEIGFFIYDGGFTGNLDITTATLTNDTWSMATFVMDGTNWSLYVDGTLDQSNTHDKALIQIRDWELGAGSFDSKYSANSFDEVGIWNRALTPTEIGNLYNGGLGLGINYTDNFFPEITLNSPTTDANYTTTQSFTFNFTASDDINLDSVKLYVNDVLNQTNATGINDTDYLFDLNLGDGDWTIYGKATDNNSAETDSANVTFVIDSTDPILTTALNLTDIITYNLPINSTWNYTASDTHIDSCYYNTSDNATQIVHSCNASIPTEWATGGNKTIQYCANDTFGNENCLTGYAYVYYIIETQTDSPDPIAESFDATFNFIVNLTDIPTTTAILWFNNTAYSPTTTTAGTNGYEFERTITIPEGWGNTTGVTKYYNWSYNITGVVTDQETSNDNITIYEMAIDNCSDYGELIFNFSVLDEGLLAEANESLDIDVEADLILTSKENASQYVTYSNTWLKDNNPQICVPTGVINNSDYWIDLTIGFDSTDRVWEFFYIDSGTLNSTKVYESFNGLTTPDINLMDLLTTDSTSFLFNYFDVDGLAVDGSIVHVMRKYIGEGEFREVERAKADESGDTIVHLVEEDVIYYFMITKDGELLYTSSEYTALCQATPCTIQIEASGESAVFPTDWDLIDGGAYDITSSASTRVVNMTYETNTTSTMNLTIYKYESDGSYSVVDSGSDTGTEGAIVLTIPQVAGNVSFFASVTKDDEFVNSEWIDFEQDARDRFGVTLAVFLGALIVLTLGLFAVSEGTATLVYVMLGVFVSGALGLITTKLSTGVNIVTYLILAGGILLWKLTRRRD